LTRISLTVRHGGAPDDLQSFANDKCERLDKFLRGEARIEFVLERDHEAWKGEVILHGSRHHERFVAHEGHAEAHGCVEKLVDKIARQLGRSKERRKDHHGPAMGDDRAPAGDAGGDEPSFDEVLRGELDGVDAKGGAKGDVKRDAKAGAKGGVPRDAKGDAKGDSKGDAPDAKETRKPAKRDAKPRERK
jgi:ribosomal subunit interface protein